METRNNTPSDEYVKYYQHIWDYHQGSPFEKSIALFQDYARQNKPKHTSIKETLSMFCSKFGYANQHKNTLACTTGYLLFCITRDMVWEEETFELKFDEKMQAIEHVIQTATNTSAMKFIKERGLLRSSFYYSEKPLGGEICHHFTSIHNLDWMTFVLKYTCTDQWTFALTNGLVGSAELVSAYINSENPRNDLSTLARVACHLVLTDQEIRKLFNLALSKQRYGVAEILFYISNKVNIYPQQYEYHQRLNYLLLNVFPDNIKVKNELIFDLLEHSSDKKLDEMNSHTIFSDKYKFKDSATEIYRKLHKNQAFIENYDLVRERFLEYFIINYEQALYFAIYSQELLLVSEILKSKKVNVNELCWLSREQGLQRSRLKITPLIYMFEEAMNSVSSPCYIEKNTNTIVAKYLEVIECLILHYPDSFTISDSAGNSVSLYFERLIRQIGLYHRNFTESSLKDCKKNVEDTFKKCKLAANYFTLFRGNNDAGSILHELPEDVCKLIGKSMAKLM